MQKYLKNGMILWDQFKGYGALADYGEIMFFKMTKDGKKYITGNPKLFKFPIGGGYSGGMREGLCYFILIAPHGL